MASAPQGTGLYGVSPCREQAVSGKLSMGKSSTETRPSDVNQPIVASVEVAPRGAVDGSYKPHPLGGVVD